MSDCSVATSGPAQHPREQVDTVPVPAASTDDPHPAREDSR